jgi:hypothetical protein
MQSRFIPSSAHWMLAIFTFACVSADTTAMAAETGAPTPTAQAAGTLEAVKPQSEDPDKKTLVQILCDLAEHAHTAFSIETTDIPKATAKAFKDWEVRMNLPAVEGQMSTDYYRVSVNTKSYVPIFIADYSGTSPAKFRAIVVARDGKILGESMDVAK